jgi:hypothetical protein
VFKASNGILHSPGGFLFNPQKLQGAKIVARPGGEFKTTRLLPKKSIN